MNTILSVVLLLAILVLAWAVLTAAEKIYKAVEKPTSKTSQDKWQGNRVRPSGNHS